MNSSAAATRVATTISTFKWVAIAGLVFLAVLVLIGGISSDNGTATMISFVVAVAAVFYALVTWVLFGWFEHTLRMLANISQNTTPVNDPARDQYSGI